MADRTPPDSPHVRSGVSSFSHISSPASYQFSRDGDASDEEGSSWSSDEVSTTFACSLSHEHCCYRGLICLQKISAKCAEICDKIDIWCVFELCCMADCVNCAQPSMHDDSPCDYAETGSPHPILHLQLLICFPPVCITPWHQHMLPA